MHPAFAEWYRSAGIEPDAAALPKRWEGIKQFSAGCEEVAALTRLFFGLGSVAEPFLAAFRAPLQKADAAFPMRKNDKELAVLAGAKLVIVIEDEEDPDLASFAALALVSAAAQNLRPPPLVSEIVEMAVGLLAEKALARGKPSEEEEEELPEEVEAELKKACEANDASQLEEPLAEIAAELRTLRAGQRHMLAALAAQSEESDMLWWLFGGHSRDLRQRIDSLPTAAASLIVGKELADLTRTIPGPPAALAFLDRALRTTNKGKPPTTVSLSDAINKTPADWRKTTAAARTATPLAMLMPISEAIRVSLTVGPKDDWRPAFLHAAGFAADAEIEPSRLAYQTYLEGLLHRAWMEMATVDE